jgi:DNA-binding XRE family transcriptional regulator
MRNTAVLQSSFFRKYACQVKTMKIYDYHGKANIAGTNIRRLRRKRKLSQDELAARLQVAGVDLDQRAISRMERQERFLADFELREIARILQVSMEELTD